MKQEANRSKIANAMKLKLEKTAHCFASTFGRNNNNKTRRLLTMDKVLGWFWKSSSQDGVKVEQSTIDKKQEQSSVDMRQERKLEVKTADATRAASVNKNNNAFVVDNVKETRTESITTVSDQTSSLLNTFQQFLQKHTYLQPEDCLVCKLTLTGCATLFLITGIYFIRQQRRILKVEKKMTSTHNTITLIQYGLVTAIWAVLLQKEWYNALTKPPGLEPRSFQQAAKLDMLRFSPYLLRDFEAEKEAQAKKEAEREKENEK